MRLYLYLYQTKTDTMKTNLLAHTLAAAIAIGIAFPAMAATGSDTRSAADKPEVKILFHHTSENPYDIRLLSWCGGLASRVQIVPKTDKTLVIAYNTGDLKGAKITGRAPTRIGFVVCKAGKTTLLFDLLSLDKRASMLPNMVTRVSNKTEWRMALDLQNRGLLDVKTFAHTGICNDRYAYSPVPATNRSNPAFKL